MKEKARFKYRAFRLEISRRASPGFKAALALADLLEGKAAVSIVQPPDTLPEAWDLADQTTAGFIPQVYIDTALPVEAFRRKLKNDTPALFLPFRIVQAGLRR